MQIRVIAAIIVREGRMLVCRRPEHKRHGGLWEFPGGKVETGEDDLAAARRELREELGLEVVSIGEPECAFADPGSPYLIVFLPVVADGEPVCHEHTAAIWGTPAELAPLPLAPTDRRYVEYLLAHRSASSGAN